MTTATTEKPIEAPIQNLRIRFWGVQGSCPMFPEPHEVDEYRWMVAQDALQRVLRDLRKKASDGGAGAVERLLAITDDRAALMTYLRTLGASVAGCVFNRAGTRDYMASVPPASLRSVSAGPLARSPRQQSRFGPLVESIMMYMPTAEEV